MFFAASVFSRRSELTTSAKMFTEYFLIIFYTPIMSKASKHTKYMQKVTTASMHGGAKLVRVASIFCLFLQDLLDIILQILAVPHHYHCEFFSYVYYVIPKSILYNHWYKWSYSRHATVCPSVCVPVCLSITPKVPLWIPSGTRKLHFLKKQEEQNGPVIGETRRGRPCW